MPADKKKVTEPVKEATLDRLAVMRDLAQKLVDELANGETVETEKDAQTALDESEAIIKLLQGELDAAEED